MRFKRTDYLNAVKWDGKNFEEIVNIAGIDNIAYQTKNLYWTNAEVPSDLKLFLKSPGSPFMEIPVGTYVFAFEKPINDMGATGPFAMDALNFETGYEKAE